MLGTAYPTPLRGRGPPLKFTIEARAGYIKAEMRDRQTAEETRQFVGALVDAVRSHHIFRVLISVRESRAIFKVEEWHFSDAVAQAMRMGGLKVAFISDAPEVSMSQQYIAMLGRQRGLAFKDFASEAEAVAWLVEGGNGDATASQ